MSDTKESVYVGDEHKDYPRSMWIDEVVKGLTENSYWTWVSRQTKIEHMVVTFPITMHIRVEDGCVQDTELTDADGIAIPFSLELDDADAQEEEEEEETGDD